MIITDERGLNLRAPGGAEINIMAEDGQPLSLVDAERAVCTPTEWLRAPASVRPPGSEGVFTVAGNVIIRFVWPRSGTPLQALGAFERGDLSRIPATAGALLAAATAGHYPVAGVHAIAQLCARQQDAEPTLKLKSAHDLDLEAGQFLLDLAARRAPVVPRGTLNVPRFWLAVSERLWRPRYLALRYGAGTEAYPSLILLAAAHLQRIEAREIVFCDRKFAVPPERVTDAWPTANLAEAGRMTPEQARFLYPSLPDSAGLPLTFLDQDPLPPAALTHVRGVITALVRDASANAVFAPHGGFVLRLPEDYPLRQWGITECRVWSEPDGMWFYVCTQPGRPALGFRWMPDLDFERLPDGQATSSTAWVEATAAALWRDQVVAGETVIRPRDGRPVSPVAASAARSAAKSPVRTLPARRIVLTGQREWSDQAEREAIARRAHGVRGHLRHLPDGWSSSAAALGYAEDHGVLLPAGATFVRPHVRGVAGDEAAEVGRAEIVVRARGLATVMALLR